MDKVLPGIFRFLISILAGLFVGLLLVLSYSCLLLLCQAIYYALFDRSADAVVLAGGLKSVVFELPLVTFGLPFLDAGICPGVLTGAVAHRLRSLRGQALAGTASALFFSFVVWRTYDLFDPVLTVGFILLEICIAVSVAWIDARIVRWRGCVSDSELGVWNEGKHSYWNCLYFAPFGGQF